MDVFPNKDMSKKFKNADFKFSVCFNYDKSIRYDITDYKENVNLSEQPISDVDYFCNLYKD